MLAIETFLRPSRPILETSLVNEAAARLDPVYQPKPMAWREWTQRHFPGFTSAPFAPHHVDLWEWAAALEHGEAPRPFIACWPRGGAKSTTVELACCWLGSQPKPARNYVLYVSETQAQADRHVTAIAGMLERVGVSRAVNEYGASKGWRHTEIRASNGFNVTAMGLDSAMRGAKLDEFRPDLIVFDDIDGRHDSANTVEKKIETITTSIMPTGSTDAAIVVVQNMIHQHGIMAQLIDGRADFLHDRLPAEPIPAIRGLETEQHREPDGTLLYRIVAGEPTWAGQSVKVCEGQIRKWGLRAFLREAQHEVQGTNNGILKRQWLRFWQYPGQGLDPVAFDGVAQPLVDLPGFFDMQLQSWDLSFKQTTSGSYVAGLVGGVLGAQTFLLDRFRERTDFPGTVAAFLAMTERWPNATTKLVEDKANGPALMDTLRSRVPGIISVAPDGTKEARMHAAAPYVEGGGLVLPHPQLAPWVKEFVDEVTSFPLAANDDQADALSQLLRRVMANTRGGYTMGDVMAAMFGDA